MIELPPGAITLLEAPLVAHLATLNRDGSVQVTPLWIDVEDGLLVFNTAVGRVKDRNLQRDARCTIEITSDEDDEYYVEIRCVAERRDTASGDAHSHEIAVKYTGERFRDLEPDEQRVKWYLTPQRVLGPAAHGQL
jgi:PPOX class probable F420-dependent enzyme